VPTRDDHFSLLGLPVRFSIDAQDLEDAYRRAQSHVHPDRFATASATERRIAMQWAARVNEAFHTLKSPLRRAAYLCELHGVPVAAESNTAMPAAFLAQQLHWRENLDEARGASDPRRIDALVADVSAERAALLRQTAAAIDEHGDYEQAAALVRRLMFVERLGDEVGAAREAVAVRAE
jgi:molecular chaperone HscB